MSESIVLYRKRLKYLPKYAVGHRKRVVVCFTVDPDVRARAEEKLLYGQSMSAILEALLAGWVTGTYVIEKAKP